MAKQRFLKIFFLAWLVLLFLPFSSHASAPAPQDPPISYQRYDVEIEIKPDGNFIVREIQQLKFEGEYRTAFAEIPREFTTNISNISLWEDEQLYRQETAASAPGTYSVLSNRDTLGIEWAYTPTTPGEVRTFILQYEVSGGLWIYSDETVLEWRAVPADRSGFPVQESQVTVTLPEAVAADPLQLTAFGPPFTTRVEENQIIFTAGEAIPDGTHFQVAVGFPPGLVTAEVQPWQIAEDTARLAYRIEAIEVHLEIQPDGRLLVDERQRVAVEAGALYSGNRTIRLAYLDSLMDFAVSEGEQPFSPDPGDCLSYCFTVTGPGQPGPWILYDPEQRRVVIDEEQAGEILLNWEFPALVRGEATTFHLQYQVLGAISQTEAGQRLNWTPVFSGRDVPVDSAVLSVILPPGLSWEDVFIEGGTLRRRLDGSMAMVHAGPVEPGQSWQVSLLLPAGATQGPKPVWQRTLETAQATAQQAEIRRARFQLGAAVLAALILIGGLLAAWFTWYHWGRDQLAPLMPDYLSEPPSTLPPGIVAYLLHEKPTPKGALASLFHLASLGLIRLDLAGELRLQSNWTQNLAQDQAVQTPNGTTVTIPGHLVTLFNALRLHLPTTETAPLYRITDAFQLALPAVYAEMAEEATQFFTTLPEQARHHWLSRGQWLVLGGILGGFISWFIWIESLGWIALAPALALIPVGTAYMIISRWMPQRSEAGVAEAARWQAFQRYLQNLKNYGNLTQAQKILDDHFAYAVALDVEEAVLAQAESLGGHMPTWTQAAHFEPIAPATPSGSRPQSTWSARNQPPPPLRLVRGRSPDTPVEARSAEAAGPVSAPLSLQGLSQGLGRSLTAASERVGQLLNTAAQTTQEDTPFSLIWKGTSEITWEVGTATGEILGEILEAAASGEGSGGYSGSSSSSSSTRWSSSSSRSSSSSSSGRSSSSRRSGGGGRRGFG